MILDLESWMNIRRFRALHAAGATFAEIGRGCGCDCRTVGPEVFGRGGTFDSAGESAAGRQPAEADHPFIALVEAWLRTDIDLKATVIHERLVVEHGFTGTYQRVKMFVVEVRPRMAAELAEGDHNPLTGLHRRFEVVPGAQAQVDSGRGGRPARTYLDFVDLLLEEEVGFRIQRKRKRGTNEEYICTFIGQRPMSLKAKIRALTHRTSQQDRVSCWPGSTRSCTVGRTT
jgi:hypothetical protein